MIRHRQEAESVPTVSTIPLSEPLTMTTAISSPRNAFLTLRKKIYRGLQTIDRLATPALAGTTLAWLSFRITAKSWLYLHHQWAPSASDLLFAYCLTLLIVFPLAFRKGRGHGWFAVLAAWISTSLSLARSYGSTLNLSWPWPENGDKAFYFAKQQFPAIAFIVLIGAVLWVPIVLAIYRWRKPLSERS
jgi:hypothetical protein